MFRLLNFVAYQLAWFACVLGAAHHLASAGAAFAIAVTAVHLALRRDASELRLVACAAAIGFLVDSALVRTHFVEFASTNLDGWAPYWMVSLWMAFATTLNHSLRWLMKPAVGRDAFRRDRRAARISGGCEARRDDARDAVPAMLAHRAALGRRDGNRSVADASLRD